MNFYKFLSLFLVCFLFLNSAPLAAAQNNRSANRFVEPSQKASKWAEKELRRMTIEEKVGQLVSVGINARFLNQDNPEFVELKRHVEANKVGGIVLFASPVYEAVHLTNRMQAAAKYPLLISADFEYGTGMRFEDTVSFPWNMAVAATGEPELARRQGEFTAREARALGVHHVFAPVVDVNNNADNPVINVRSYGENPADVSRFGAAFINGLQAENVLATVKHFPGHGDTAVDSHRGLPIINLPRSRFDQIELVPFKNAIDAGVASVMVAHIALPQIDATEIKPLEKPIAPVNAPEGTEIVAEKAYLPATLSPVVNKQILRKELGFKGLIVTDAMDMSGLTLYFHQDEAAVRAFLAGADMILKPADVDLAIRGLSEAVKSGRIPEARLNESVGKILALKYELGLTKNRLAPIEALDTIVASQAARDLSQEIANKAVTLVKSEGGAIPLIKNGKIFVLGITNGDDKSWVGNTFLREMRRGGMKFDAAILDERSTEKEIRETLEKARRAEIIIAPLYGRVRTGQARSVGLPDSSVKVLRDLLAENKNVVGISFGNPYLLTAFPQMKTYLVAYGDMAVLQRATARAVLGEQDIRGRLPISLPGLFPIGTGIQIKKAETTAVK
ncbi:MAG TPA: glycoside hydrolase family 3 N-terminal domain-containing protein [Pyrinomonadaceae bacterium]|jgi:beta-glucosidase-like glycosyl hydrolase